MDTPEPPWDDGRTVQWLLEGSPSIGLGSQQGNSPHWSPPLQEGVAPSPPPLPSPRPLPSPGRLTPASQRSPPSWAGTPVRRPTPSPQYSPTRSAPPLNQDQLRRQIELLTQDQQQRYQNRSIQAVTHTNTITTVYKDGRPPSVHRTSSRSSTPRTPETPPTPVRF